MATDQRIGVLWKLLFGTVTCLSFAMPVLADSAKLTNLTSCPDELKCKMVQLPDGTMLQTVPKLFSPPAVIAGKIPGQHIICRIPDCGKNLCKNGWCEETMVGYNCTCSSGFQGRHCDEMIIESTKEATTKPTTSPSTTMTERSDTTTSQNTTTSESVITEAKTKSEPTPRAMMLERSDATTSQEITISKSTELSTTDATSKPATSITSTMSDTTTSQDTTITKSTKEATNKPTTSPSTTMTERSDSKTSQSTTTSEWEAKNKSVTSPTATMPERSDATTSQETTTSKSAESSTTDVTTKPTMSPTATVSDTTTSPETTASTCSSPPVDCEFGGSFYNFSTSEMNHSSAVSACSEYGSHLVFIESQEEEDFIARHVEYRKNYWIGLTGLSLSEARWLDGSNLTYQRLHQASFRENVNCFLIWFNGYSWEDKDCSERLRFICEKEVGI